MTGRRSYLILQIVISALLAPIKCTASAGFNSTSGNVVLLAVGRLVRGPPAVRAKNIPVVVANIGRWISATEITPEPFLTALIQRSCFCQIVGVVVERPRAVARL